MRLCEVLMQPIATAVYLFSPCRPCSGRRQCCARSLSATCTTTYRNVAYFRFFFSGFSVTYFRFNVKQLWILMYGRFNTSEFYPRACAVNQIIIEDFIFYSCICGLFFLVFSFMVQQNISKKWALYNDLSLQCKKYINFTTTRKF